MFVLLATLVWSDTDWLRVKCIMCASLNGASDVASVPDALVMQIWVAHGRFAFTLSLKPSPLIPPSRLPSIPLFIDTIPLCRGQPAEVTSHNAVSLSKA